MSRLLPAAAVLLMIVSAVRATHLETVFSASLPYPEVPSLAGGASSLIFKDGLYVVCGAGSTVEAFNLTTRTNMWVSPNLTSIGSIESFTVSGPAVLLSFFGYFIVALSSKTGQQLWVQNGYQLQLLNQGAAAFTYGNTIYAQVALSPPTEFYALQAFDLATGTPGYFQYGNELKIDGNTAYIAQYSIGSGNQVTDSTLRAVDIPTNTTLWTVPCSDQAPGTLISASSSEYIALSNWTVGDEVVVVLHRKNGSVAQSFQAFNGFSASGVAKLLGNMLFALIGDEYQRYVLADIATGYITWTRSAGEIGIGGVVSGNAVVAISSSLVLSVSPIGSNSPSISIPQVPSQPAPAIVDFGFGVVLVGNLQGYTMWDTNTGDFLGSDEQDPNGALSAPQPWNGLSVIVSGNVVTALKVAA